MTQEPYKIYYKDHASMEEESALLNGIIQEAALAKGMDPITPFAFFIKDLQNQIAAGAKGVTLYGCLYVDLLWVSLELRSKGLGSQLMEACEKLGRDRGCTFSSLTTMDWEALPFYQKQGYAIEYIREGYEKNSKMYVLRKSL